MEKERVVVVPYTVSVVLVKLWRKSGLRVGCNLIPCMRRVRSFSETVEPAVAKAHTLWPQFYKTLEKVWAVALSHA